MLFRVIKANYWNAVDLILGEERCNYSHFLTDLIVNEILLN